MERRGAGEGIASTKAFPRGRQSMQIRSMVDMWNQRIIIEPGNGFAQGMEGGFATRNVASI